MIMAVTQGCSGGGFGGTRHDGSAFVGADALRAGAGGAGNGAAGANSALAGAAVGDAGLAERPVNDGEILRSVSRWSERIGKAAAESAGRPERGSTGIWGVRAGSDNERRLRGTIRRRLWHRPNHYVDQYSGRAEVYRAAWVGIVDAQFFLQPWSDVVGAARGVAAAEVCAAWTAGVLRGNVSARRDWPARATAGRSRRFEFRLRLRGV